MIYIYVLLVAFVCFSCKNVQKNDIVGIWKSEDDCVLNLNQDGTFKILNLPESVLFDKKSNKKLYSSVGKWELINFENKWEIELLFPKSESKPYSFSNALYIERKFGDKNGWWSIYFYNGNNDEKYFFHRASTVEKNK